MKDVGNRYKELFSMGKTKFTSWMSTMVPIEKYYDRLKVAGFGEKAIKEKIIKEYSLTDYEYLLKEMQSKTTKTTKAKVII